MAHILLLWCMMARVSRQLCHWHYTTFHGMCTYQQDVRTLNQDKPIECHSNRLDFLHQYNSILCSALALLDTVNNWLGRGRGWLINRCLKIQIFIFVNFIENDYTKDTTKNQKEALPTEGFLVKDIYFWLVITVFFSHISLKNGSGELKKKCD